MGKDYYAMLLSCRNSSNTAQGRRPQLSGLLVRELIDADMIAVV